MTTYTKPFAKITPLCVATVDEHGRVAVELLVEVAGNEPTSARLTLPAPSSRGVKRKPGDSLTLQHNVVLNIHDGEEATRADIYFRMAGFRPVDERVQ